MIRVARVGRSQVVLGGMGRETSLRVYGSRRDAYRVFGDRLDSGDPPDDRDDLLKGVLTFAAGGSGCADG